MANFKPARIERLNAEPVSKALSDFVRENSLVDGLLTQAVYSAWDEASGAAQYTVGRYLKGQTLYITLSSSVVRNQLSFQKEAITDEVNRLLASSFAVSITGKALTVEKIILH